MKKRLILAVVLGSVASVATPALGAIPSLPSAIYIKLEGLTAGAGSDRGYPDSLVVTDVFVKGKRVENCGDVARIDTDPIGLITVRISLTKGYMDEASVGLRRKAERGEPIREAVLAVAEGGNRCALTFSKLSDLKVKRSGKFDELTVRFEEIKVTAPEKR